MTFSMFLILLVVGVLLLLGVSLKKLIPGFLNKRMINPTYSKLLVIALLGIWFSISIYLLLDAALGHSEIAKSLFKWKCLLAFCLIVLLPGAFLFLLHDYPFERYNEIRRWKKKLILIIIGMILLIIFSAAKSGIWPPLAFAMKNDLTGIAQLLIKMKITLNDRDAYHGVPCVYAAMKGDMKTMKLLLENGVELRGDENIGLDVLQWACLRGDRDFAELAINHGINVNTIFNNGSTPLIIAAEHGYVDFAKMLIERGADTEMRESHSKTALMVAEELGNKKMVELLKANKFNVPK